MEASYATVTVRLLVALLAGALIGMERTYHGRPAGFRTHALVSTASALLMLVTVSFRELIPGAPLETLRIDPTRMAQGIMTGIGFLGAGVILKEGLSIRGLTTAASIWMTAAIGIVIGVGLYYPAALAEVIALGTLALFRWVESLVPSLKYGRLAIQFQTDTNLSEDELGRLLNDHGISFTGTAYYLGNEGFQYEMTVRSRDVKNFQRLAETLKGTSNVRSFSITPTGD